MKVFFKKNKFLIACPYMLKDTVKFIGAIWDSSFKCWTLPFTINNYQNILELPDVEIDHQITAYFSQKMDLINDFEAELSLDKLKTKPYRHQTALLSLALRKNKILFSCSVGTGKSKPAIDTISVLCAQKKLNRCLIICPASLMINWANEIKMHSHYEYTIISGTLNQRKEKLHVSTLFHIINYNILNKLVNELLENKYEAIIFDEIHNCKTRSALQSRACYALSKLVAIKIGLTGTLIANNPADVFNIYKIIDPEIFGTSFARFKEDHLVMGGFNAGYGPTQVMGLKNKHKFQKLLAVNSLKFNLDDIIDLPPEIDIVKEYEFDPKTNQFYKDCRDEFVYEYEAEKRDNVSNVLEKMLRLAQIESGFTVNPETRDYYDFSDTKLKFLESILDELIDEKKIIIWARFTHSIDRIAALLKSLDISYYIYDGRQTKKDLYVDYQSDNTRVWLGQIQTGIGYSIPCAAYAIYYELDYSRINFTQSKGRNRRLVGTNKKCIYYYLHASGALDLFSILKQKDFTAADAMSQIKSEY